ncbi:MAG TPA: helix-turn-helix transcriptional regulator [Humisphaera sp.]
MTSEDGIVCGVAEHRTDTISDQLRAAIAAAAAEDGVTRADIARATGVTEGALSRFVHGQRELDLSSVNKLAGFLRLRLVREARRRTKPNTPKRK